ncbi:MAG: hypothetical protein U0547_08155 [Dehalococcoidia bacterium]
MREALRAGAAQAATLVMAAVVFGAIAGLFGLSGDDAAERASAAHIPYLLLAAINPLLLVAMNHTVTKPRLFVPMARAFAVLIVAGIGGALVGGVAFLVPAMNIVAIFTDEGSAGMNEALRAELWPDGLIAVVASTAVAAVAVAVWTNVRVSAYLRTRGGG